MSVHCSALYGLLRPVNARVQIVFALRTLRTFDFSSASLLDFLCRSVSSYLKSESAVVRTEAVLACGEGGRIHVRVYFLEISL